MNLIELLCELCIERPGRGPRAPERELLDLHVCSSLCARARVRLVRPDQECPLRECFLL